MIAPTISPSMTLLDYYLTIYKPRRLAGRAESSDRQYRINLRHFDRYLGRPALLSDLDDDVVTGALGWKLQQSRSPSPATANKMRNHLLSLWRYAAMKRHVPEGPDVRPLKEYKRTPTAWTPEQFAKLLAASQVHGQHCRRIGRMPARIWWHCLLLVLYDTGIRIGAAHGLKVEDFDPESRRLLVPAEVQKQSADQVFILSEQTATALAESVRAFPREKLFPWPFSRGLLYHRLNVLLKLAGLPHGRRDKFHRVRRTSATLAEVFAGQGTATAHLGHSSPKVTERYIDPSFLPQNHVAEKLPRPNVEAVYATADEQNAPEDATIDRKIVPYREWIAGDPLQQPKVEDGVLLVLLAEYVQWMASKGRSAAWIRDTVVHLRGLFRALEFTMASDIDCQKIKEYLSGRLQQQLASRGGHRKGRNSLGMAARTAVNYRTHVAGFLRYLVLERGIYGAVMTGLAELEEQYERKVVLP